MMKICLSLRLRLATALSLFLFLLPGTAQAQNRAEGKSPVLHAEIPFLQQQWPSVIAFRADFASLLTAAGMTQPFQEETLAAQAGDSEQPLPLSIQKEDGVFRVLVQVPGADKQSEIGAAKAIRLQFGGLPAKASPLQATENLVWNGDFSLLDQAGHPVALNLPKEAFNLVEGIGGGRALAFNSTVEKRIQLTTPWIRIPECSKLEYSFRYRTEGGKAHHYNIVAYAYINFLDRDGKRLPRQSVLSSHVETSDGWQEERMTITLPPEAVATNFEFNSASSVPGSVILDEVKIVPANLPELLQVRSEEGKTFSLMPEHPGIFRFDLGPANSPVMQGFLPLTPETEYSEERGWGFVKLARFAARDKKRPDALARDYLAAAKASFQVRLPKGDYIVWTLSGDSQADGAVPYFFFNQTLRINRNEVFRDDTKPADFFQTYDLQNYQHFWLPGMDYHDTFTAPRFQEKQFTASVDKEFLQLEWENFPLCALIIYPAEKQSELAGELSRLQRRRKIDAQIRLEPGPQETACKPSFLEKRKGFIVFRRPDSDPVFPSSRPQAKERLEELSTFAAPEQVASVHFSLYPLQDFGVVQAKVSDLTAAEKTIKASQIDVRIVRYIFRRTGEGAFQVAPFLLDCRDQVPVHAETCWTWYLLIRVPKNAAADTYKGEVSLFSVDQEKVLQKIPFQLQVLPYQLEPLPILQGYYYSPSEPWYATFWRANVLGATLRGDPEIMKIIEENERRELRFMKDLGLNSASFGDDIRGDMELVDGEARFKEDNRFTFWMDIYASEGMGKMPFYGFQSIGCGTGNVNKIFWLDRNNAALKEQFSPEWNRAYLGLIRHGMELQKARQWPEILWYVSDERSNYREVGAQQGVELAKLVRQIPGAVSIASMNGPWEHIMVPYLDISMPNIAFPITDETLELLKKHQSKLWLYNCGSQRLTLGLYPWRVKAGGRFQWHYRSYGEQWDDGTCEGASRYVISFNSPNGVIPALAAQNVREAIYDHRYMVTLEKTLSRAKQLLTEKESAALRKCVDNAEELISFTQSRVPVDVREVIGFRIDPRAAGAALGGEFRNTDNLERCRWSIASLTADLLKEIAHAQK
ncbi:MAG TPA: hypothetical protein PKY10_01080 [Lentisphaeria bacterium]|nr:hypothetical protein [Lentisphaeria bacterium]